MIHHWWKIHSTKQKQISMIKKKKIKGEDSGEKGKKIINDF